MYCVKISFYLIKSNYFNDCSKMAKAKKAETTAATGPAATADGRSLH